MDLDFLQISRIDIEKHEDQLYINFELCKILRKSQTYHGGFYAICRLLYRFIVEAASPSSSMEAKRQGG